MKLKKWLENMDIGYGMAEVYIGFDEEPDYKGYLDNIPWRYRNYKIVKKGIRMGTKENEYGVKSPLVVITLDEEA